MVAKLNFSTVKRQVKFRRRFNNRLSTGSRSRPPFAIIRFCGRVLLFWNRFRLVLNKNNYF